jgi:hypothetical protein
MHMFICIIIFMNVVRKKTKRHIIWNEKYIICITCIKFQD